MDIVLFDDYEVLADTVVSMAQNVSYTTAIVCKYDDAKKILCELIMTNKLNIMSIELEEPKFSDYNKEYLITVSDDMELWIEPLYREKGYIWFDGDIVFITGDSNIQAIHTVDKDKCYETYFGEIPKEYELKEDQEDDEKAETNEEDDSELDELLKELLVKLVDIF